MIIVRPISRQDLKIFVEMTFESTLGMTNLPRNQDRIYEKIVSSEMSFLKKIKKPDKEEYYFVLQDLVTGHIGGICGILAKSSQSRQLFYRLESLDTKAHHISAPLKMDVLRVVSNYKQASEVCSLYLQPTFRHSGQGRLLSLSRFLFIASQRHRFEKKILAELRGWVDQKQISPFWQAVGRHFCNLSFVEIMTQFDQGRVFISEILPKFPIYIDLLPIKAQKVIGKTHENTKPALKMLLEENFLYENEVDVFEAGPILSAPTSIIRTIKNSGLIKIDLTSNLLMEESEFILSNEKLDFRSCFGRLQFISKTYGMINEQTAYALQVNPGDFIRYVTIH